jgi:2-oxoglutarate ferredoxin oxidoreductase subunit alpha
MFQKTSRYVIKFAGESGQGINLAGEILSRALKDSGYYTFSYREYPSLIEGGFASYQIDISTNAINSSLSKCNILVCVSRSAIHEYLPSLGENGLLIHSLPKVQFLPDEQKHIMENGIQVEYVNAEELASLNGGRPVMANTAMMGVLWKVMGLEKSFVESRLKKRFEGKEGVYEVNSKILAAGASLQLEGGSYENLSVTNLLHRGEEYDRPDLTGSLIITGNHALSIGAISAGMRAYFAYPMTPSSTILTYLSQSYKDSGILIKQAEDEITAAQMCLGSMFMGTRAMTATSGGGYDLMTESVTMAGMTETPFLCVLAQRAGTATGLPTWTGADNLNVAVYGGHGDFPRCVISVSDPESANVLVQKAFNIAEQFQIPVILLTDKQVAESLYWVETLPKPIPIRRGLTEENKDRPFSSEDRYKLTPLGVSPRWLPGTSDTTYLANSDEHDQAGNSTEDADMTEQMVDKRMMKLDTIMDSIEKPVLYGSESPDILFVGWGSVKNSVIDLINLPSTATEGLKIGYLHYEYLFPLRTQTLMELAEISKNVVLIENNRTGQLGNMLESECDIKFTDKLLKYDGRQFFLDDLLDYINTY